MNFRQVKNTNKIFFFASVLISILTSQTEAQSITGFTLVNSITNSDLRNLNTSDTIDLTIDGTSLNIRANVSGTVGSVKFEYDEANISSSGSSSTAVESVAPYALRGDQGGNYQNWTPSEGNHTLSATAYTEASAGGTAGTPNTVKFVVIRSTETGVTEYDPPEDPGTGEVEVTGELKKWHRITLSFDGPLYQETDIEPNPFLDYRLNVTFRNGEKSFVVPGYFSADGDAGESSASSGNIWRVHFSPDEVGTWNWEASFRIGPHVAVSLIDSVGIAVTPIDGQTGSFNVAASDKTGDDLRAKGRLEYVGMHHLRFAETGEFFLKGGPDAPENMLAYEDFDGDFKSDGQGDGKVKSWSPHAGDWNSGDPSWKDGMGTEIIGAVNYLASEGLNAFSFLTMNINGDDKNVFPYVSYSDYRHMDCSKLDQWGVLFHHAMTKGMYLHFKTQETENETLLDGGALGTDRKLYYRELVARFGYLLALNWNLGEENNDQTHQQRKDMAQYFYDIDPYHHHIVIHTFPGAQNEIYTPLLGDASKLTGVSIQKAWNNVHDATDEWVSKSAVAGKKWVVANDEQGSAKIGVPDDSYSGTPSLNDIRKQTLWGNLMAGGAGVEYYFGYDLPHSDLTCEDFRSRNISWDFVRFALEFFKNNNVPFWQMLQKDGLVSRGWCLAMEGQVYVIYLASGGTADLTVNVDTTYNIKWYDPRSGGNLLDGSVTTISGTGAKSLGNAPNNSTRDWVILVTNADGINAPPIANANADTTSGRDSLLVSFDASSSYDTDGTISSYEWDLGDGTTAVGIETIHEFTEPGSYEVKLTVTDDQGARSTDLILIDVTEKDPLSCEDADFVESNGILIVEIESMPTGTGWVMESEVSGYTGNSYYRWNGGDRFNDPGNGMMEYKIKINSPGTYHFRWHNKIMHGTDNTESNDSWLRIPDADDFFARNGNSVKYPKGGMFVQSNITTNGASKNGWMKVYCSGTSNWTWSCRTSDNDPHEIYATFNNPGVYTVQISGRSNNHALDRFVMFQDQYYSVSKATNKTLPETACNGSEPLYYELEVNYGNGSGFYSPGNIVPISADEIQGKEFVKWIGNTESIVDVFSANTTFVMGSSYARISATYVDSVYYYSLTVNNGSGSGNYEYLEPVSIEADDPPQGMVFDHWTGDVDRLSDSTSVSTFCLIPDYDVTVTAIYEEIVSICPGDQAGIMIYPNPAREKVIISNLNGRGTIQLSSMTGKVLKIINYDDSKTVLEITNLEPSIYLLKITDHEMQSVVKRIAVE